MASYISQVVIGNNTYPLGSLLYGTCDTAADTAAKEVSLAAFDTLATGITVYVSFDNGNTAVNPTLKVGSTATKTITNPNGVTTWNAKSIIGFTYDGTNWVMNSTEPDLSDYAPLASAALTGIPTAPTATAGTNTNQIATTAFVMTAVSGLTGAMHFVGISSTAITDGCTEKPTINGSIVNDIAAGDVVLYNSGEFVWSGSAWELLGDESSYALKSNTTSAI